MNYYNNFRKEVFDIIPISPRKVLEIGCGEGNFKRNFPCDVEYWGVEPSSAAIEAEKHLSRVIQGFYEAIEAQLPNNYFDLIVVNDVIEHMIDPENFLSHIKCKLRDGGLIVGSVPNVRFYDNLIEVIFRRDWRYRSAGILDSTHLRFFTKKSLKRMLISQDFELVFFGGINGFRLIPKSFKKICKILIIILFGLDSRFLQFAFAIKPIRAL